MIAQLGAVIACVATTVFAASRRTTWLVVPVCNVSVPRSGSVNGGVVIAPLATPPPDVARVP